MQGSADCLPHFDQHGATQHERWGNRNFLSHHGSLDEPAVWMLKLGRTRVEPCGAHLGHHISAEAAQPCLASPSTWQNAAYMLSALCAISLGAGPDAAEETISHEPTWTRFVAASSARSPEAFFCHCLSLMRGSALLQTKTHSLAGSSSADWQIEKRGVVDSSGEPPQPASPELCVIAIYLQALLLLPANIHNYSAAFLWLSGAPIAHFHRTIQF
jgi:hypothetical protein